MFDPNFGDNDSTGFEVTKELNSTNFGNKEMYRKSNENLYNMKH